MPIHELYPENLRNDGNFWLWKPIYRKIKYQNQHLAIVIVGAPGCGKSYLSLYMASLLDPHFKVEDCVVFSAAEFAKRITQKLPKGASIIIDDSGLTAGSSDAMTKEVKAISKIMQSVRSRNLIIILNLPNFFLLAKSVRTLLGYYAEPVQINRRQKICHAKFKILKINPLSGEVYRYSPIIKKTEPHWTGYSHTQKYKITTVAFPKPSKEICIAYEKLKKLRMEEFNEKQNKKLNVKPTRQDTMRNLVEELKLKLKDYLNNGELNVAKIANDYEVPKAVVKDALAIMNFKPDKGRRYVYKNYFENGKLEDIKSGKSLE